MAILLSRLGRFAYRRAIPVLIAWLLLAAGTVIGGLALDLVQSGKLSLWLSGLGVLLIMAGMVVAQSGRADKRGE